MDASAGRDGEEKEKEEGGGEHGKRVSFTGLFRYADGTDLLLMLVGTVAALGNGVSQPLMIVIFGDIIDDFGGATTDNVLHRVNKAVLSFVYLAIGTALVSFLQVACWTITGERQAARIRSLYLKSVLRQDISFFDVEMTTGQIVSRMSGDTVLVQDAIGEKVGKFLQLVATFIGGFVVAFVKGWLLSLAMLACIPPVVIAGGAVAKDDATFAANFIDKLPNGYDTMVGQRGAQLSGGQKQRIAIARAIIKNPKILLLDEATSALDVESERIVQEALNRIMVDRTTLVVAHRLTTVRNADCISVVQQGKIVEQGLHDELVLNPDGAYSQLIRLQENHEEEQKIDRRMLDPWSKSTSLSLKRSISRGFAGNSSGHSFTLPLGLPGSVELPEGNDTHGENPKELDGDGEAPKKAPMGRLARLNMPELHIILLGSLAAAVHGVLFPMLGIVISSAIKTFYEPPDKLRKDSSFWALMCVVLGILSIISIPAELFLFGIAGGKLIERIRARSFRSIVHQEVAWFDDPKNSSGALGARLAVDALNVRRLVGDNLALTVQIVATLITGFVIAMIADWKLSLVILCVIPLVGIQGYAQVKFLKGFSQDAKMMHEDASQVATDAISSIRTVASFCSEKRITGIYDQKCEASMNQGVRTGIVGGIGFGFSFLMLYLTYSLCFYVGAQFMRHGQSDFGGVFKVLFTLVLATVGVSQTSAMATDSTKAKDSAISIFALLDRESEIDSTSNEGLPLDEVKGNIDFQHVSFKYPTRPDIQIFSDFTLHIPSGKTVALVGESGSGKSTVIGLLERFYNPDSGTISLDGVEIKSLNINWLRDQTGLVSQEPVLFNDTIRANIAYGKDGEVTEEELIAAAKASNAHEFISSLPQGYDTTVGERGIQLSGGQKQRVAIARAILKDPKILLLDEATSALDAESERIVQDALDHVMVSRTTVVVAHRLTTIKGADIIAVLKDGAIAEKGRHEALMNIKDGVYASLVELRSASS